MSRSADTLDQLKANLSAHGDSVMLALFGQPTQKGARWWRWGRKGSLSYRTDRATFHSFETDQGGSLLDAIMFANGCSFPDAVRWARQWLGEDPEQPRPKPKPKAPAFDADSEHQLAIDEARALWRAGRSLHGTAGARNLAARAIDGWPTDGARFIGAADVARIVTSPGDKGRGRKRWSWWRWCALMFPLTDAAGAVTAVQLVALTDQGEAIRHWEHGGKVKMVRGAGIGSALRLPGDDAGPLVVAEGGETALSIWLATGYETWATMGAIGRAPLDGTPKGRAIIVARDDDKPDAPSRKVLRKAIDRWRADGRHVAVAQPWPLSRGDKSDFNDVLQAAGPDAVRDQIDAAIRPQDLPPGKGRATARLELSTAIGRTVADLLAHPADSDGDDQARAPFKVIRATLGLGKSEAALSTVLDAIGNGGRCVYSVPTHKLAAELAERAEAMAAKRGRKVTIRVWHGREAEDPAAPDQAMCLDLEPVELAQQAGVDVLETVCAGCEHRLSCAYLAQREERADLWLVPHALLFSEVPAAMSGASLLVIDEDFTFAGMVGTQGAPSLVALDTLREAVMAGNRKAEASADLNASLALPRRLLLDAMADHPASAHGEGLERAALVKAGLTAELAAMAAKDEGRRVLTVSRLDAATRADLKRALRELVAGNVAAKRAAMLWAHLADVLADDGPEKAGRVELVDHDGGRAFRLYGLQRMGKGWRKMPALHLDATADIELVRYRIPNAELVADVVAAEPNVTIRQYTGRTFGKTALEKNRTTADDARRFAVAMAAEQGGRWLMVASKGASEAWQGQLPPYVETAHWGGLRGLDSFNDVSGLVVVGRWGAPPDVVGRMAAILTGRSVPRVGTRYPTAAVNVLADDGSARTIDAERHPDAIAEKVRKAVVDAEILQAIGRGRGVQRGPDAPLQVIVLGNVPLPVPLASVHDWQPVDPWRAMLADHGAVLSSAGDAADVVGKTRKAIRRERERLAPGPNIELLFGQGANLPPGLAAAAYQRRGAGRSEERAIYDPRRIIDIRTWLEGHLGPLSFCDADQAPEAVPADLIKPHIPAPAFADQYARETPADRPAASTAAFAEQYAREGQHQAVTDASPTRVEVTPPSPAAEFSGAVKGGAPAGNFCAVRARDDGDRATGRGPRFMAAPIDSATVADHPFWSTGGTMPPELVAFTRIAWRASGISQQALADLVELSRPQLANGLQGRFGLSPAAAGRLREALTALPARAPDLFDMMTA